jgi:hypothetical protein
MTETSSYAAALVELDCQGQGSRKRARGAKFIPVWGDASWDVKLDDARDGKKDLAEATGTCGITTRRRWRGNISLTTQFSVSISREASGGDDRRGPRVNHVDYGDLCGEELAMGTEEETQQPLADRAPG